MTTLEEIARARLRNQRLLGEQFDAPAEVVRWLVAVQAQDFPAAKWALGLRLNEATETSVDQAFNDGTILRTHVLRPTWHFVMPEDIRWLLKLTAPRIIASTATQYRRTGLDGPVIARSNRTLVRELQGGKHLTRTALVTALKAANIQTDNLGYNLLVMRAELDGLICSGPRRGKQFTYMLLDERAPALDNFNRDEALRSLAARYFTSHGPATPHDFAWWSGLTVGDARHAIEMLGSDLERVEVDGRTYFTGTASATGDDEEHSVLLLPIYDEAIVAYRDRSAYLRRLARQKTPLPENIVFNHTILVDGQLVGIWKRSPSAHTVTIEPTFFTRLRRSEVREVEQAIERHAAFFGLTLATPVFDSSES
ncbi:MAG TPA: winged helix DNA-binding domain-containing protein [Nitrolancea sp.]|nr:winged helix DNA-binding domain-containing protein [Nitrolancea sp.]